MILLAANNSSVADKARADVVCDGVDDQVEINAALAADEGEVFLYAGEYRLTASTGLPTDVTGSILIQRSRAVLSGEGPDTILFLEDEQRCNVIRTIGDGLSAIRVQNLHIEPNAANNGTQGGFDWLEICGIKYKTTGSVPLYDIWVEGVSFGRVTGVGAYMWGDASHVRSCVFKGADHDVAELCSGQGGDITGCTCVLDAGETAAYVFGTDDHNNALIADNLTIVRAGASVSQAVHRTWPARYRNVIKGNRVISDGGTIVRAFQIMGYENVLTNNVVRGNDYTSLGTRTIIDVNGSTMIGSSNVILFCNVIFTPTAPYNVQISNNVLRDVILPDDPSVSVIDNLIIHEDFLLAEPDVIITSGDGYRIRIGES